MVTFLCSSEAGFITGQIINVDGGSHSHAAHLADIRALKTAAVDRADDSASTGPTA
jgi:hypothetical protein